MTIHDTLDLMNPKPDYTHTGTYYKDRPDSPAVGGVEFNYKPVNPYSKTWRVIFSRIQAEAQETAIETDDNIAYKAGGGYVVLQDGNLYSVAQVQIDETRAPRQAFRTFGIAVGTVYLMRLTQVDNPWSLK